MAIVDEFGRLVKTNSQARAAFVRLRGPGALEGAFPIPDIAAIAEGSVPQQSSEWLRMAQIERVKEGADTLGFMLIVPANSRLASLAVGPDIDGRIGAHPGVFRHHRQKFTVACGYPRKRSSLPKLRFQFCSSARQVRARNYLREASIRPARGPMAPSWHWIAAACPGIC